MGFGYKGSQGQTKRTVELQEEEEVVPQQDNLFSVFCRTLKDRIQARNRAYAANHHMLKVRL
jgi:hypothetical protein